MDSVHNRSQKQPESEIDEAGIDADEDLGEQAQNDDDFSSELVDESDLVDENEFDDEDVDASISLVTKPSVKEKNAHELEVRRAIEERMAERQLSADLDYLEMDFD